MTAYTTAELVIAAMPEGARPKDTDADYEELVDRIESLADMTAEMIDAELGWNFHAQQAGSRIVDGRNARLLHLHEGFVAATKVEIRFSATGDWEEIESGDWEAVSMYEAEGARPFDHIHLTGAGRSRFPSGSRNVRLSLTPGWATPPARLVEANTAWVRQHLAAGDSFSGAMAVPDAPAILVPRLVMPDDVRIFLHRESHRYQECWT